MSICYAHTYVVSLTLLPAVCVCVWGSGIRDYSRTAGTERAVDIAYEGPLVSAHSLRRIPNRRSKHRWQVSWHLLSGYAGKMYLHMVTRAQRGVHRISNGPLSSPGTRVASKRKH